MQAETKALAVTKVEAEHILDSTRISNPATRDLALKIAGVVLEFATEEETRQAALLVATHTPAPATRPAE